MVQFNSLAVPPGPIKHIDSHPHAVAAVSTRVFCPRFLASVPHWSRASPTPPNWVKLESVEASNVARGKRCVVFSSMQIIRKCGFRNMGWELFAGILLRMWAPGKFQVLFTVPFTMQDAAGGTISSKSTPQHPSKQMRLINHLLALYHRKNRCFACRGETVRWSRTDAWWTRLRVRSF